MTEKEKTGVGRRRKQGVESKKERGSKGVLRVQGNEISICSKKRRKK